MPKGKTSPVREQLAQRFLDALKENQLPWSKGWSFDPPKNTVSGKTYRGVNRFYLTLVAMVKGYDDPRWCTFKQASDKGWKIRKGEKSTPVEYWACWDKKQNKLITFTEAARLIRDNGEEYEENLRISVKTYAVFNCEQMDGVPEYRKNKLDIGKLREKRDTIIKNLNVGFAEGGAEAYYSPTVDCITLPMEQSFEGAYDYMATFLHEAGHSTGHPSRLDRDLTGRFGTDSYAKEELRAEIASAFVAQELGIPQPDTVNEAHMKSHMAYIQSWAKAIEDAPGELMKAIQDAEKIADYLISKSEIELDKGTEIDAAEVPEQLPESQTLGETEQKMSLPSMNEFRYELTPGEASMDHYGTVSDQQYKNAAGWIGDMTCQYHKGRKSPYSMEWTGADGKPGTVEEIKTIAAFFEQYLSDKNNQKIPNNSKPTGVDNVRQYTIRSDEGHYFIFFNIKNKNLQIRAYDKNEMENHIAKAALHGVTIPASKKVKGFHIADGDNIRILSPGGKTVQELPVRYVDDTHVLFGNAFYSTKDFSNKISVKGASAIPIRKNLPEYCYHLKRDPYEIVEISKGKIGYTIMDTQFPHSMGKAKAWVSVRNRALGVTTAQHKAMLAGSALGWDTASADPSTYPAADQELEAEVVYHRQRNPKDRDREL